jgi:hypothetical protein
MAYYPSYPANSAFQPTATPGSESLPSSSITEETETTIYTIDRENATVVDKARGSRPPRLNHLSAADFIGYLRSRAAAVFLIKLNITEDDFCTYIIPGCRRSSRIFEVLWPVVQKTFQDWTHKSFDPHNLDAEVFANSMSIGRTITKV